MTWTEWECGVCGRRFDKEQSLKGHIGTMMDADRSDTRRHPRWSELEVSSDDLSAWKVENPSITDF